MGRKLTQEEKDHLSDVAKLQGRQPPGYDPTGTKHSEETKAKMRASHASRTISDEERKAKSESAKRLWATRRDEIRRRMNKPNTDEHNAKISASWTPERRALQGKATSKRFSLGLMGKSDTGIEKWMSDVLDSLHAKYIKQFFCLDHPWDFALPDQGVFIEVDGCYWHGCNLCGFPDKRLTRDQELTAVARGQGWRVIRVPEHAILSIPRMVVARIKAVL